jgi:hypothetical protein
VTAWLTWKDSNFHVPLSKNSFEMSTEFPLFWPKIQPGDFCTVSCESETTRPSKHQTESLEPIGGIGLTDGH